MKKHILILTFLIFTNLCFSQTAGALDLSFGTYGYVTSSFNFYDDWCYALLVQPDGKVVVAGEFGNGYDYDFAIIRYNDDGTLDNTFGVSGRVNIPIGNGDDIAYDIALQPDGKIVAVGTTLNGFNKDIALVRCNTNGTLDSTFGTAGTTITDIGGANDYANAIKLQNDGKILVAGYTFVSSYNNFSVLRFNNNGILDTTFGTGGISISDIGNSDNGIMDIALQTDNKIVVAGWSSNGVPFYYDFAVARLDTNGILDSSFGQNGYVITAVGNSLNSSSAIAIQPDGKIVVAGTANIGYEDFAVVRYNIDGTLDNSFGAGGKVTTAVGSSSDYANDMVIQPDGRIILAGYSYNGSTNNNTSLVRYNIDGTLDVSFGVNGKTIQPIGSYGNGSWAIALQSDGKILTGGWTLGGGDNDMAVARFFGSSANAVSELVPDDYLMIYPNPAINKFTIETAIQSNDVTISIYNIEGKLLLKQTIKGKKTDIDISDFSKGMYYIKVETYNRVFLNKYIIIL